MPATSPVRRFAIALLMSGGLAIGALACSSSSSDGSGDQPAIAVTVHISDGAFDPRVVEIEPGGTVMWINDDITTHSLTFLRGDLRSGGIRSTRSWIHTFDAAGVYRYFDDIRNTMKGTVVVRPAP